VTILGKPHQLHFPAPFDPTEVRIIKSHIKGHNAIGRLNHFLMTQNDLMADGQLHYIFILGDNAAGAGNRKEDLFVPEGYSPTSHAIVGLPMTIPRQAPAVRSRISGRTTLNWRWRPWATCWTSAVRTGRTI
jgi:hypothetical protein